MDTYLAEADIAGREDRIEQGAIERGLRQGLKQGLYEGLQKGIQKGIEKGIEQEKKEVAMRLLTEGLQIELIAKITGLSISAIEVLHDDLYGNILKIALICVKFNEL